MKISIIIPVFNTAHYIVPCIQSVISQTYHGDLECLLVDDCGNDNSIELAQRLIDSYHGPIRFRIIRHSCNRGLSAARNIGMEKAQGNYLFFLDSDDKLTSDCIEVLALPLLEEEYDIVLGDTQTIGDSQLQEFLRLKLPNGTVLRDTQIQQTYRKQWNMMAQNKLYRTKFLREKSLFFREGLVFEDELWCFEIACFAKSIRIVNTPTYLYYIRQGSITTTINCNQKRKVEILEELVKEMRLFLYNKNIFSAPSYHIIQKFIDDILHYYGVNREEFLVHYIHLRRTAFFPCQYHLKAIGMHPRHLLQSIHYFLPPTIGARYKYWRIKQVKRC
jgi:glycosyltransferase involved in cell wall biosynthesis